MVHFRLGDFEPDFLQSAIPNCYFLHISVLSFHIMKNHLSWEDLKRLLNFIFQVSRKILFSFGG